MATRKLWLSFGQSNAGPSADWATWAARHPELNLATVSNIAVGSSTDKFTMPGSFPGYTTLDLRGVAISELRYLVWYNPVVTGYNTYPNTGRLRTGAHTTTVLLVEQTFEAAAVGMVIVRKLTGVSHTISAVTPNAAGATITVTPALSPTPVNGEEYTYQMAGLTGTTPVTLPLGFGVLWDGALTGLRLLCITGANAGASRVITGWTNSTREAVLASAFGSAIGGTDTFEIQPQAGTFSTFAYWLPFTPFTASATANKINPYPPGFDYASHWHTPIQYNRNVGASSGTPGTISYHVLLGIRLREFFGETIYMLSSDFGGSFLRHQETATGGTAIGWWDPAQQSYWAPGATGNCYARMMAELDVAIALAAVDGDVFEIVGVSYPQGEGDAGSEVGANAYASNVRELKRRLRTDLKARSLWSQAAERIIFVQPEIAGSDSVDAPATWTYGDTVNQAIRQVCSEDRFSASFSVADVAHKSDLAHYTGAGASILGQRVFDGWQAVYKTTRDTGAVDICNLALSHIGQSARITAIDPPDGSAQASLCAQYYTQALESVLVARNWSFANRRRSLSAVTYAALSQWRYAYQLPGDVLKCVAVQGPGASDDYTVPGTIQGVYSYVAPLSVMRSPQTFDIETMPDGTRIIVSNTEDAVLRYVARVTDTSQYPPQFRMAVSYQLASLLAGPTLKGDVGSAESKRLLQMAAYYMGEASATDANQRDVRPEHVPDWLADR